MTEQKKDIFDRIMELPGLRVFQPLYRKQKEALLYLFFGGLAFVLNIAVFALLSNVFHLDPLLGNVISWIITVLFAFYTNRIWVFQAPTATKKEFFQQLASFFSGRIVTLLIEELLLGIFITWLQFPEIPVKVVAQVVVIVLNYVISKLFIFHSK